MNHSAKDHAVYVYYQGDRKIGNFHDAKPVIDFRSLKADEKAAFKKLNFVDAHIEGINYPLDFIDDVLADTQYFILQVRKELFFIDTQGYNYCRYVAKIVNFEGELSLFFPM